MIKLIFFWIFGIILFSSGIIQSIKKTEWFQLENYSFEKYIQEYNKNYSSTEYIFRKNIFEHRLKNIIQHNLNLNNSWKKGVNLFTDYTKDELKKLFGLNKNLFYSLKLKDHKSKIILTNINSSFITATNVDWREKNIITPVKDQGQCGSCWSFGTAEIIESYWALKKNHLMELSEQQILDCTPNPNHCGGVGGCGGGTAEIAYQKIIELGGLSSEWTYPYISYFGTNFKCKLNITRPIAKILKYSVLESNKYEPVIQALTNIGPLVINVDASSWFDYETGVFNGCNEKDIDINHVVQLIGYGTDSKFGDYWLIRNSWSPMWGENGYMRLKRSKNVSCGIDKKPQDGTGCDGGPDQIVVCGECGILYDASFPVM